MHAVFFATKYCSVDINIFSQMSKPMCLFSEPVLRKYQTTSKLSRAYMFYICFWISVIAPPIILAITLRNEPVEAVFLTQPSVSYSGNYFISVNGIESSSLSPNPTASVQLDQVDVDNDGRNDFLSVSITVTGATAQNPLPLFIALELTDSGSISGIARLKLDERLPYNRLNAKYYVTVHEDIPTCTLPSILSQSGPKGLAKVAAVQSAYELTSSGFGTVGESVSNSNSFLVDLRIYIGVSPKISNPTTRDVVRENLVYFLVYLISNYLVLKWFAGLILKSGIINMKLINESESSKQL